MPPKKSRTTARKKAASRKKETNRRSSSKTAGAKKSTPRKTGTKKNSTQTSRAKKPAATARRSRSEATSKEPARRKKTSRPGRLRQFFGLLPAILFGAGLGIACYAWFQSSNPPVSVPAHSEIQKTLTMKTRQFDKAHKEAVPPVAKPAGPAAQVSAPAPAPRKNIPDNRPRAAIIIDDIGDDMAVAERFFNLDVPLTYSILPHTRYQCEIAEAAFHQGYQVMLHLPMEPEEYPLVDPGPGALLTAMTPDERIRQLNVNLNAVPHIQGVNNHMGSEMTARSDQMHQIFTVLKKQGLFFIDSRTTAATQCRSAARLFKLAFAERDVFLDHVQTREAIRRQIAEFINVAEINGTAIAIGHPHALTYEVLSALLPDISRRVRLVPVSELVQVF